MARKGLAHCVMLGHQVWKTAKCQCQREVWSSEEQGAEGITWHAGPVTLQVEMWVQETHRKPQSWQGAQEQETSI